MPVEVEVPVEVPIEAPVEVEVPVEVPIEAPVEVEVPIEAPVEQININEPNISIITEESSYVEISNLPRPEIKIKIKNPVKANHNKVLNLFSYGR